MSGTTLMFFFEDKAIPFRPESGNLFQKYLSLPNSDEYFLIAQVITQVPVVQDRTGEIRSNVVHKIIRREEDLQFVLEQGQKDGVTVDLFLYSKSFLQAGV